MTSPWKCKFLQTYHINIISNHADSDDNEFRMEEEMARLAAEKEAIEAEKKMLTRKYDRLLHDYVIFIFMIFLH